MYHFQTNLTVPVGRWGDKLIKLTRFTVAIHFDVLPVLDYVYICIYIYMYILLVVWNIFYLPIYWE